MATADGCDPAMVTQEIEGEALGSRHRALEQPGVHPGEVLMAHDPKNDRADFPLIGSFSHFRNYEKVKVAAG